MAQTNASLNDQLEAFRVNFEQRDKSENDEKLSWSLRVAKRILCFCNKNCQIFFRKYLSIQEIHQATKSEKLSVDSISKSLKIILQALLSNKKHRLLLGPTDNTFSLYDSMISRLCRKEQVKILALEMMQVILSLFLLAMSDLALRYYKFMFDHQYEAIGILIACCTCFPLLDILTRYRIKLTDAIVVRRRQALRMLVYDKLAITDTYFLAVSDNNMIHMLLYDYLDAYSLKTRLKYFEHLPLLILISSLIITMAWRNGGIFHPIQLCLVFTNLIPGLISPFKNRTQIKRKHIESEQRRITYEYMYNFNHIQASRLNNRFNELFSRVLDRKKLITRNLYIYSRILNMAISPEIPTLVIGGYYFVALCVYPSTYLISDATEGNSASHFLLKAAPDFKQIFGLLLMQIFSRPFTLYSIHAFESTYNWLEAKKTYDIFFGNDLIIEPPANQREDMELGSIILDNCEVYERHRKTTALAVSDIMQGDERLADTKQFLRSQITFSILESARRKSKYASNDDLPSSLYFHESDNSKSQRLGKQNSKSTLRLRQLFSSIKIEISPGAKLCIYDRGKNEHCRDFFKILIGDCLIGKGQLLMKGKPFYFNPHYMSFVVNSTIQDNILFGTEYNADRYKEVLRFLNITFDAYNGRDMYQISEKAGNLKIDDKHMILLARMLYSNSDIFLIEDYLNDRGTLLNMALMQNIFSTYLRVKTVVFNSSLFQFIDFSTEIIQFETRDKFWVFKTEEFRGVYKMYRRATRKLLEDGKQVMLQNKIKNSIFIGSTGFEEELAIHKKANIQKKEIENFKKKNSNIVDHLAKGILLTQQRRQEGVFIEELGLAKSTIFLKYYLKKLWLHSPILLLLYLITLVASLAFYYLFEWHIVFSEVYMRGFKTKSFTPSRIIQVNVFLLLYVLCKLASTTIFGKLNSKTIEKLHKDILLKLQTVSPQFIERLRYHSMLERLNTDFSCLQYTYVPNVQGRIECVLEIIICSCLASTINSIVLPFIAAFSIIPWILIAYFQLQTSLVKILKLRDHYSRKLASLQYQLLKLIPSYRFMRKSSKLEYQYIQLCNNLAAIEQTINSCIVQVLHKVSGWNEVSALLGFLVILSINNIFEIMNFLHTNMGLYVYGILIAIRLFSTLRELRVLFTDRYREDLDRMTKLQDFIEKIEANQRVISKVSWKKLEFDDTAPIVFKHISLTLGYRPVLRKISFAVRPLERFGIVGIDGSGRNTIFHILSGLKIIDQDEKSKVTVFGLNITELDQKLQEEIFIIESNPNLLVGTVKSNIDPYGKCSDQKIIDILVEFKLFSIYARTMEIGFELFEIKQNSNFPKSKISEINLISERQPELGDILSENKGSIKDNVENHEGLKSQKSFVSFKDLPNHSSNRQILQLAPSGSKINIAGRAESSKNDRFGCHVNDNNGSVTPLSKIMNKQKVLAQEDIILRRLKSDQMSKGNILLSSARKYNSKK